MNQSEFINDTLQVLFSHHGAAPPLSENETFIMENHTLLRPTHYSTSFQLIAATISAIIFIVGLIGNVLVVIVIARTRSMHTPTNCYLLSLAVADILVLLSATLPAIPEPFFQIDEWRFGRVLCSLLIFLQYLGVDASSASITAFTVERYFAICKPMRAQTMCTVNRAKKIIVGIWILTTIYCSPWLGLTDLRRVQQTDGHIIEKCDFRLSRSSYLAYFMTDLVIFYVIPFIISAVLYCLIGRILFSDSLNISRGDNRSDIHAKRHSQARVQVSYSERLTIITIPFFPLFQVVRMLFVVVLVFATLWMPYRVIVVYNSFATNKYMDLWFLLFSRSMVYINSAINPILYNAMSVKFRRAFRNHLCCGRYIFYNFKT
ncbi:hypothetical protein LOTGIDRAFT_122499 [Lottia gigantea]|uniref:Thyrotropin-releasing hormone receptor n=1 Tax=Lottia gigantea TaxID=225164 RepID=V4A7L7_LOTGI|nr:hypothetical protein LOTGIDRAFT_122499 [Lottia gigantea]ESO91015.1 hypothetical protein LOTGIDRAFT_122499 [Lottia gigantea]